MAAQALRSFAAQRWVGLSATARDQADFFVPLQLERLHDLDPELVLQVNPSHKVGKSVWALLQQCARKLENLPPTHLLRAAFPDGDRLLQRVCTLWAEGIVTLYVVPEEALRVNDDIGYAAVSSLAPPELGGVLSVYAGVPWNLREYGEDIFVQVAEALIHEVCARAARVGAVGASAVAATSAATEDGA